MASKNRPKELIKDIIFVAAAYAKEDYPEEEGYVVSVKGRYIVVTRKDKKGEYHTVFLLNIYRYF